MKATSTSFPLAPHNSVPGARYSVLCCVLLAVSGCGGPAHEFAEVDGKVTLNNKPLPGVMVRFYPIREAREQLPYATGITDAAGAYTLTHQSGEPGALVGANRAVVSWPARDRRGVERDGPPPLPGPPIPIQYTEASATPFTVEVKSGSRQTIDLPLED